MEERRLSSGTVYALPVIFARIRQKKRFFSAREGEIFAEIWNGYSDKRSERRFVLSLLIPSFFLMINLCLSMASLLTHARALPRPSGVSET